MYVAGWFDSRHGDRLAGADTVRVVREPPGEVVGAAEDVRDPYRRPRERPGRREHGLRLPLALAVVGVEERGVVPGESEVDGRGQGIDVRLPDGGDGVLVLVDLDGGRQHIAAGAAGEDAHGDGCLPRGVADLVDDHVEAARAERRAQRLLVVAVGDEVDRARGRP